MEHGMGGHERVAVAAVAASHRTEAPGPQRLLVAACYLAIGACGAWAIRSVVESRPAELFAAWLAVSVVLASLWAMRPRHQGWPDGDLGELTLQPSHRRR